MLNTPKSTQIGIRLSPAERAALEAQAARDRRQLSDWCRLVLLRAARATRRKGSRRAVA